MPDKILVADDDLQTVNFLKIMLERQGYQVLTAGDGPQTLQLAYRERPDLVILDVMMPGMDGFEVARGLRANPATAKTPILMFTAKTSVNDKLTGYNAGVDIYLTKPIHPVELNANIKTLLSQKRAQSELPESRRGFILGVMGARGGTGVSTLALNLTISFHQKKGIKAIAAELRPGQGTWASELHLPDPSGLAKLLGMNTPEITQEAVRDHLAQTNFGPRILLASDNPHDIAFASAAGQYEALIHTLSQMTPLVVLDIGTPFLPMYELVISLCNEILLVMEPVPAAVKRAVSITADLRKKGYGSAKTLTYITTNRTRSDLILSTSQIEQMLDQAIALGFPPAAEMAFRAYEQGIPLIQVQPESMIAQQFVALADQIATRVTARQSV
ncbi:MAG: response regulator [Anaerolineales bacterium]|nr:response regulator [Anaerolineales bacterium]